MEIVLLWCFVLAWMGKRGAEDLVHAVKGTPNPRYELKQQRAKAAGQRPAQLPRYGGREWFADLYSDALVAHTERRRKSAKAKAQPIDDLADALRESPVPGNKANPVPAFRYETPEPVPTPVSTKRHEMPEPIIKPTAQAKPAPRSEPDKREPAKKPIQYSWTGMRTNQGEPMCHRCQKAYRRMNPPSECGCPDVAEHTAQIIRFPNPKNIEKEITMASSEVTGLSTAIAYADAVSKAHESFTSAGAEGYVGALEQGGNGAEVVSSAREAMEASSIATGKWAAHKSVLEKQLNVREAYQGNPDAGNKQFVVNE